jgi:hypothetical protein
MRRPALTAALLLTGCYGGGGYGNEKKEERPTDYALLTVSGHCFIGCGDWNEEYPTTQGTAQVLEDALPDADGIVVSGAFVDSYWSWVDDRTDEALARLPGSRGRARVPR